MTWSVLNADEAALFEGREMTPCFLDDDEPIDRLMYSRSLCGVPVSMSVCDLEHSLSILCVFGFHGAVREVLSQIAKTWSNHRCLADCYTGYGMFGDLVPLLERSAEACNYVLALALANVSDEKKSVYIVQAQDLARSALAKHAAHEALRGLR